MSGHIIYVCAMHHCSLNAIEFGLILEQHKRMYLAYNPITKLQQCKSSTFHVDVGGYIEI